MAEYTPSDEDLIRAWKAYRDAADAANAWVREDDAEPAKDEAHRALARVRRDAAREALDGLAEDVRAEWDREHRWVASAVGAFRDKHCPETEDEFDRFIEKVKRDAARDALSVAAQEIDLTEYPPEYGYVSAGAAAAHWLADHRDTHYPEEAP